MKELLKLSIKKCFDIWIIGIIWIILIIIKSFTA